MNKKLLFFICVILFTNDVLAQDEKKFELRKSARLEAGFIFGKNSKDGNNFFPGGNFQYSYCIKTGHHIGIGLGLGLQFFKNEAFIPFHIDFIGLLNNKDNAPFTVFQLGYSIGISSKYPDLQDHKFRGGIHFLGGFGKKCMINDKFSAYTALAYNYQYASLQYTDELGEKQKEKIHNNMILLSIGLMLEQY